MSDSSPWPHEELADDFRYALGIGSWASPPNIGTATAPTQPLQIELGDVGVAEVVRYKVSYHGQEWTPESGTGTELDLAAVIRLADGRWASVEAWNDYTGWGCQDSSDVRIGASEDDVIRYGLSQEGRTRLGYELTPAP